MRQEDDTFSPDLVEKVKVAFPYKKHDLATWGFSGRLYPHILALTEHPAAMGYESAAMFSLLNEAALYAKNIRFDFAVALRLLHRALAINEKLHGPAHLTVAIRANNIGQILLAQADLAGAKIYKA